MKLLIDLFLAFFKMGIMTFGGGLAMLPMLEKEIVEKRKWADRDELLDYYAIGQCTPGIIAVNVATFIGCKLKGIWGGVFATFGVVCPSVIIILIIATFLRSFAEISYVQNAFVGIRIAVCALVVSTVIKLIKNSVKDIFGIIVLICAFLILVLFDVSPVIVVIIAVMLGITANLIKEKR